MKRYLIFGSAGLGLLMYSIDSTAVAVAFPHLIQDLHTNVLWAGWTVSIYLVAVMSSMPLMGILSDTYGRKKVYLASLVLFTASSLACGFAPNIYVLVIFRFLQGIGGSSFLPTAAGIVSDQFPENRQSAIGLFTSIFPIGGIIGPNLGGWIVSQFSWRYIFYINLPIGIVLIGLIAILLHDGKVSSKPNIDFAGAAFFFGAILFLMLGLNHLAENFSVFSLFLAVLLLGVSFFFFYLFFRQEQKASNPILDMALLRSRPFFAANLFNMIVGAGVFGIFSFIPLYAISVQKLTVLASGMILTPRSIGTISTSALTSFLLKRWGYRRPIVLGVILVSLSTILLGDQEFHAVQDPRHPPGGDRKPPHPDHGDRHRLGNAPACLQQRLHRTDARKGGHDHRAAGDVPIRRRGVRHLADHHHPPFKLHPRGGIPDGLHRLWHRVIARHSAGLPHALGKKREGSKLAA